MKKQSQPTRYLMHIRNRYFFITDILMLALASYGSYVLRLETFDFGTGMLPRGFLLFTLMIVLVIPLIFWQSGVYSRYWRYASVEEVLLLTGAVTLGTLLAAGISFLAIQVMPGTNTIPPSIPFIFLLLALTGTALPRIGARLAHRSTEQRKSDEQGTPVVVMGAGQAGSMIVREIQRNPHLDLDVVAYLDDDRSKHGMRIHGIPIIGARNDIPLVVQQYNIKQVVIAMPAAPGKAIRDIVHICEQAGVQTRTMPGMYELLRDQTRISQLRNVQIEDLLRREPVHTDIAAVRYLIQGKRVLVTGGGGSIGSELCRQILHCEPESLVLVGHGENSIFAIGNELQHVIRDAWRERTDHRQIPELHTIIADIRFQERIQRVFEEHQPHIVFHAAAHKHVPLMELNPAEAITNNILGTRNLLTSAQAGGVERFVMISTDKAVNPTSIMGTTKRVAELLVHQAAKATGLPYVAVRFGNVLGSRGSVILTFKQQIADGGPITVTHPDVTRYFMTIPEAVQLVLQAAVLGQGKQVFMLDMGDPVKIVDLARDMIELSGLEVGRDIDIVFSGLRPGEKLYEELFLTGEEYEPTPHAKIFLVVNASTITPAYLNQMVDALAVAAEHNDREGMIRLLKTLVPEYSGTWSSGPPERRSAGAPER